MSGGVPSRRATMFNIDIPRNRRDTIAETSAKFYAPTMDHLSTSHHHRNFARMSKVEGTMPRLTVEPGELRRFSVVQVNIMNLIY